MKEQNYNLKKATRNFLAKKYDTALRLFNEVLLGDSNNIVAKMGILLCDIAFENEEQAQKLFDYYQLTKSQNLQNPEENIINLIHILDKNANHFVTLLHDYEEAQINDIDGILYQDFKNMLSEQNDFKKMFEYAMFSTKIVFTKKSDFYEFLNLLIDNNLASFSLQYIESLKNDIIYDNEIQKIIKRAFKNLENNHQ